MYKVPFIKIILSIMVIKTMALSTNEDPALPPKYYVHSDKCQMPYINPYSEELMKIWKPPKFKSCTNTTDLIRTHFDEKHSRYVLQLNKEIIDELGHDVICSYVTITRGHTDNEIKLKSEVNFKNNTFVPQNVHSIIAKCVNRQNPHIIIQEDAFAFVQYKKLNLHHLRYSRGKYYNRRSQTETGEQPSIILIGFDTLSRSNFRRNMPKMFRFLEENQWYEMQGYNKVADNTLPNLLATLAGYTTDTADQKFCNTHDVGCFDSMPFVWKDFKRSGYVTAYAEDLYQINTFQYFKPGFIRPPVDYYLRPFVVGIETNMHTEKHFGFNYCVGRRLSLNYIFNYCLDFVQRFIEDHRPMFGLFWSSSFTHENFMGASTMDDLVFDYGLQLNDSGLFQKSIVIFFSDHGVRWGQLRHLSEGFLEERLPMLFIWLPPWFQKKYPQYAKALRENKNRLTSNYDLHMTLKHISHLGTHNEHKYKPKPPPDCPKCMSLFYEVPKNRGCSDAAIGEHWCTCEPFETIESDSFAQKITKLTVSRINDYIEDNGWNKICSLLALKKLEYIERKIKFTDSSPLADDINTQTYRLQFTVIPNEADFEATVRYNFALKDLSINVETISRLNSYKQDSKCLKHKEGKKFCVCFESIGLQRLE